MSKHILLCDDDQSIIEVISIILNAKGYAVSTVLHCEEIMEKVRQIKPNIILLDLQIPGGGERAATVLKSDTEAARIPLIIFSANPHIEEISKKIGADGYLAKPFEITELEELMRKYA